MAAMFIIKYFLLFLLFVATLGNPCDHQENTYKSQFSPQSEDGVFAMTPFFSPNNSTEVLTELIKSAKKSIDIGTPHFKSWMKCGDSYHEGCTVEVMRNNGTDPLWAALLNAIHRGVDVRIVANDCLKYPKTGLIDPLGFLALCGADVRRFTTLTFYHAKYIMVDERKASISSINLSSSSMIDNREAGLLLEDTTDGTVMGLFKDVFNFDFNAGTKWPIDPSQFTQEELDVIADTTEIPIPSYPNSTSECCYNPIDTIIREKANIMALTMPDFAHDVLWKMSNRTTTSLYLYIYAINDPSECQILVDLKNRGIEVKALFSSSTIGDFSRAEKCYNYLYETGIAPRMTKKNCMNFWHQKFWVVDGKELWLSTGNWDSHDFPDASNYPPNPDANWVYANRGFTVMIENQNIVHSYQHVMEEDWAGGYDYTPKTSDQ